jgi:hypothetical protein
MILPTLRIGAIVSALGAIMCAPAALAAEPPQSLLQMFNRIPKTPTTTQEAEKMVNANRQVPAIVSLKADLDAHETAVQSIVAAADAKIRARMGGASPEQAAQGAAKAAAVAGIDMARMQTDKAYANEVQARMKAMSPQELMAMSAAMTQGMGMRGSVAVYDPPAVKAAAEAGQALMLPEQQAARMAAYQRRWSEVDRKVAAVNAKYAARYPKMQLSCDGEGGGRPECVAEQARYVAAMRPLRIAHDSQVLQLEVAALDEERVAIAAQVRSAEQHLLAAQYGALSQELGNPTQILVLDQTTANDIKALAIRFEEVVKRSAAATGCGARFPEKSECDAMQ